MDFIERCMSVFRVFFCYACPQWGLVRRRTNGRSSFLKRCMIANQGRGPELWMQKLCAKNSNDMRRPTLFRRSASAHEVIRIFMWSIIRNALPAKLLLFAREFRLHDHLALREIRNRLANLSRSWKNECVAQHRAIIIIQPSVTMLHFH